MNGDGAIWIGVDPGGEGHFGIAILKDSEVLGTSCVDCADGAIGFVLEHTNRMPAGIGIDAPLWWSSGRSGDRNADQWLRKRYRLSGGEVQAANSLRGAALVQGVMFVQLIREAFPRVSITENHPKALLKSLQGWEVFSNHFNIAAATSNPHIQDAVIAAIAAREGFGGNWTHDLSDTRLPSEQNPKNYWLAPIYYYWPE